MIRLNPSERGRVDASELVNIDLSDTPLRPADLVGQCWQRFPQFSREIMPKRWRMPEGFANPDTLLPHALAQAQLLELSASGAFQQDRCSLTWMMSLSGFVQFGHRVYALERQLGETLLMTTPKGFSFSAVEPPLPAFLLMFPKGLLDAGPDGAVYGALVNLDKTASGFSVCALLESGAAYTFISPTDDVELARLLNAGDLQYQTAGVEVLDYAAVKLGREIPGRDALVADPPGDNERLKHITYMVLNVLAYLSTPSPDLMGGGFDRGVKKRSGKTRYPERNRDFFTPYMIGTRYRNRVRAGQSPSELMERAGPRAHWRAGHWRRQHYGPGNQSVKMVHIAPVLVGASGEE